MGEVSVKKILDGDKGIVTFLVRFRFVGGVRSGRKMKLHSSMRTLVGDPQVDLFGASSAAII
jgi:hypothetical protein